MVESKKRGRGRPKKTAPVVKKEVIKAPVKLPIKYLGVIMLNPHDPRMANHGVGNFEYDTKTQTTKLFTNEFPPNWEEFSLHIQAGYYTIKDSTTGLETMIYKSEDADKWIQHLEDATFPTIRGIYSVAQVQKIYEAA